MAWFDDPLEYYGELGDNQQPISQGDIVLAPTTILIKGASDANVAAPPDINITRRATVWHGSDEFVLPQAPPISADTRWGPAMVLPHVCAMEKEWNDKLQELIEGGMPEDAAKEAASAIEGLDANIAIAPILSYEGFPERKITAIKSGAYLGAFPIAPNEHFANVYVDLNQTTTCEWRLVAKELRVALLTAGTVAQLQHRLSEFYAFRSRSKLGDIEASVGQRIVRVQAVKRNSKLTASFILENGQTLTLQGNASPDVAPGPERPAR